MKKFLFFMYLILVTFLSFMCFCLKVNAYVGPLDEGSFYINNQNTTPFTLTINGNSNTTVTFHLIWDYNHAVTDTLDLPGQYLFFSIVSDKKIDIERSHDFGTFCSNSCFSNDDYLQLVDDNGGYSYVYYFNIVKWQRNVGTQVDLFNVDDQFKFINKESGTANVYIYGAYSNSTNEIPQYITNNDVLQQIIIGNESQTSELIQNQNENTQEIIDTNKVCTMYTGKNYLLEYKLLSSNGIETSSNYHFGISDYILVDKYTTIEVVDNTANGINSCFYTSTKQVISCIDDRDTSIGYKYTIPSNARYFRYSMYINNGKPQLNICSLGNQAISNNISDLNDNITDPNIDNPNSDFSDMEDMIAQNGVITNLIALPITLYSNILNGLNQSCTEYNFGNLFGSDIKFQCINLGSLLGNTIWGVIDVLFSGFTIYAIAKKMIKVFNNFSGLSEGDVIDD